MPPRCQMPSILSGIRQPQGTVPPRSAHAAHRVLSSDHYRAGGHVGDVAAEARSHAALRTWAGSRGRVYFLAFLNPLRGQPVPALTARLASLCHRR